MELTFRPRLSKGRHLQTVDEHGPFCLVEAVGFNVDGKVDDSHGSVDPVLAALSRTLNDRMCKHYDNPTPAATHLIDPTGDICDACQARLWAVGERIALTAVDTEHLTEAELAAVHVRLAVEAARVVQRLIDPADPLYSIVTGALAAAILCLHDASAENRAAARLAASRIENHASGATGTPGAGNDAATWAGHAAAHATRAAAAIVGDDLSDTSTTYFFTNRRSIEAITYALGATAGDPAQSMRVARKVLNAFGKATSQNETPGVSDEFAEWNGERSAAELDAARERAAAAAPSWAECEEAYAAQNSTEDEAIRESIADLGAALAEGFDAKADQHRRQVAAWMDVPVWAITPVETPTEEYEVVNDFDESEIGDVADEAIGDLSQAVLALEAIAAEHRPVAAWTRRSASSAGIHLDIEYRTECCLSCRDAKGNPIPSPCRTMAILNSYGEA